LQRPDNMGPPCIDVAVSKPTREEMRAMHRLPRNNYQRRLHWPGSLLAALGARAAAHTHRAGRRLRRK